jgi:hypothetical protein
VDKRFQFFMAKKFDICFFMLELYPQKASALKRKR